MKVTGRLLQPAIVAGGVSAQFVVKKFSFTKICHSYFVGNFLLFPVVPISISSRRALTSWRRYKRGSLGTRSGPFLVGTTCSHRFSASLRPKISPSFSACSVLHVPCPIQVATVQVGLIPREKYRGFQKDRPNFSATDVHFKFFNTFASRILSVTWERVIF